MDDLRFDELTKRLASEGVSRRRVLRALGAGLAGGALGIVGRGAGRADAAACRQVGATCGKAAQCCSGVCDARTSRCACPPGRTNCGGACFDTANDPKNCGACGKVCPSRPHATAICASGVCDFVCADGYSDCNNTAGDGCETALFSDPNNCGVCGKVCQTPATAAAALCVNGECSFVCGGGKRPCGNGCIPVNDCCDSGDCGADQICDQGMCKDDITCPAGSTICSATSRPTCCGPQTTCDAVKGLDYCCSAVAGAANWCARCGNNRFACCSQNTDVNHCVCCTAGQTCDTTGQLAACV